LCPVLVGNEYVKLILTGLVVSVSAAKKDNLLYDYSGGYIWRCLTFPMMLISMGGFRHCFPSLEALFYRHKASNVSVSFKRFENIRIAILILIIIGR